MVIIARAGGTTCDVGVAASCCVTGSCVLGEPTVRVFLFDTFLGVGFSFLCCVCVSNLISKRKRQTYLIIRFVDVYLVKCNLSRLSISKESKESKCYLASDRVSFCIDILRCIVVIVFTARGGLSAWLHLFERRMGWEQNSELRTQNNRETKFGRPVCRTIKRMSSFHVEIEPITLHAWVELPNRTIVDWNNGMPTQLQIDVHDSTSNIKLARPFKPVYSEEVDPQMLQTLVDKQRRAVGQWAEFSIKRWPGKSFLATWKPAENQCLINSFVASKQQSGRVVFGKFGWMRQDGSVYFEFDGQTQEEMLSEILRSLFKS